MPRIPLIVTVATLIAIAIGLVGCSKPYTVIVFNATSQHLLVSLETGRVHVSPSSYCAVANGARNVEIGGSRFHVFDETGSELGSLAVDAEAATRNVVNGQTFILVIKQSDIDQMRREADSLRLRR